MDKIRVLIADDHPVFREGLIRVLSEQNDMEVVGQAGDGMEAVDLVRQLSPDVAVLDVNMPKLNGIEAVKAIKENSPDTVVLLVSGYAYEPYILGAIEAGASGYLLKDTRVWDLVAAIKSAYSGGTVLDPTVAHKVFNRLSNAIGKNKKVSPSLHQREIEVLKLVAEGMSNKEIALKLSISVRTVQSHMANIFNKLNANSRTEAVVNALKEGWFVIESANTDVL